MNTGTKKTAGGLRILDLDHELTLAALGPVLIAHWVGPHDSRNGKRLEAALRKLSANQPIGFIAVVEPTAPPPDKTERARIMVVFQSLPVQALSTVVRGKPIRRSFVTMVLTAMLVLVRTDLASRTAFCTSELEAAAWIEKHLPTAPSIEELVTALRSFRSPR